MYRKASAGVCWRSCWISRLPGWVVVNFSPGGSVLSGGKRRWPSGACGASAALTVSSPTPCQSVPEQDTGDWIPSISGVAEIALLTWLSYQMCLPCFQSWIQKDIYLAHVFMGLFIEWLYGRRCSYLLCPLITSQITQSNSELWLGLNSQKNVSQSKILGTSFLPSKLMKKSGVVVRSH